MHKSLELLIGIVIGLIIGSITMAISFTIIELHEGFTPLQLEQLEEVWD